METIVKNKTVKLDIDTGLDHGSIFSRDELIAKLAILEADIKAKKKEQEFYLLTSIRKVSMLRNSY